MPHSWAVWSLSPRVIGVYTACGIWAWASPLHAQSPAWGTIHPLARFCLCLVSFFDIGIVCKLRKWGYGGDSSNGRRTVCYQVHSSTQKPNLGTAALLCKWSTLSHSPAPQRMAGFWFKLLTTGSFFTQGFRWLRLSTLGHADFSHPGALRGQHLFYISFIQQISQAMQGTLWASISP